MKPQDKCAQADERKKKNIIFIKTTQRKTSNRK